jgi:hypothetical protein
MSLLNLFTAPDGIPDPDNLALRLTIMMPGACLKSRNRLAIIWQGKERYAASLTSTHCRRHCGGLTQVCTAPIEIVEPSNSIRRSRLPGKERARQRALELFPAARALLAQKRDHGRAEALLGLYGIRNSRVVAAPPGAQPGLIKQITSNKGQNPCSMKS